MGTEVKVNVIKRNGKEVGFDVRKIANAIRKANNEVDPIHQMNPYQIEAIADKVADQCRQMARAVNVEEIQDMVETGIMEMRGYEVARKYVRYRYKRSLAGELQQEPDDQFHPAGLHRRNGQQRYHGPSAAAG